MLNAAAAALLLVLIYAAASVNFAILVLRAGGLGDPRTAHSGNPGTTNVARMAGGKVAALVLALDLTRAAMIEVLAARLLAPTLVAWAGVALVIGNRFPLWHRFRGGKGVAAYLGFVGVLCPFGAAVAAVAWVLAYACSRVAAVASMAMIACLGVATYTALPGLATLVATVSSLSLIVHGHRSNWRSTRTHRTIRAESH